MALPGALVPWLFRKQLALFYVDGLALAIAVLLPSLFALEAARIAPRLLRHPGGFWRLTQLGCDSAVRVLWQGCALLALVLSLNRNPHPLSVDSLIDLGISFMIACFVGLTAGVVTLLIPVGGPLWVAGLRKAVRRLEGARGLPAQDDLRWNLLMGERQGAAWTLRVADQRELLQESGWFPARVGLAIPFEQDGSPEEIAWLGALEDRLVDHCCAGSDARLVIVVTAPHMREFVFQAHDGARLERELKSFSEQAEGHELQTFWEPDPSWSTVEAIAAGEL